MILCKYVQYPLQKNLAQEKLSKEVREKLICEGECLDGAKEGAIPHRYASAEYHEYDDTSQVAVHARSVQKGHLQWTKTDADRHQAQ